MPIGPSIVVVGASLAGLRAAETLRAEGFDGTLTVVGDEAARALRPAAAVQAGAGRRVGRRPHRARRRRRRRRSTSTWGLGVAGHRRSTSRPARSRWPTVGRSPFDGLVIATGAAPRSLPRHRGPGRRARPAHARRRAWPSRAAPRRRRARGWWWSAPGSSAPRWRPRAASAGLEVTLVEALPAPLARVLGRRDRRGHRRASTASTASTCASASASTAIEGDGRVERVRAGRRRRSSRPTWWWSASAWSPTPAGSRAAGSTLDDGVRVRRDHPGRARAWWPPATSPAGPTGRFGEVMRVEHWENAIDMGAHAARRLLAGDGDRASRSPRCRGSGPTSTTARSSWPAGAAPTTRSRWCRARSRSGASCALYGRGGRVVGALGMNMPARVVRYRRQLADRASAGTTPWPPRPPRPTWTSERPVATAAAAAELVEVVDAAGTVLADRHPGRDAAPTACATGARYIVVLDPRRPAGGPPAGRVEGRLAGALGRRLRRRGRGRRGLGRRRPAGAGRGGRGRRPRCARLGGGAYDDDEVSRGRPGLPRPPRRALHLPRRRGGRHVRADRPGRRSTRCLAGAAGRVPGLAWPWRPRPLQALRGARP